MKHGLRINTEQIIIGMTILLLCVISAVHYMLPHSILSEFSSTSAADSVLRGSIIIMLIALFISTPPRARNFRIVIGLSSMALVAMSLFGLQHYTIGALDALLYIEVAIILAIEALEAAPASRRAVNRGSLSIA